MITYKGLTIQEATGINGVKIYEALYNSSSCFASNSSLLKLIQLIDTKENN